MDQDLSFRKVSVLPTVALLILSRIIERDTLLLALTGTTERVRDRFRRMMPERAWLLLLDELEGLGPVRLVDVEAAQQEIARFATRLVEDGVVSLYPVREPAYPADEFIWLLRANDNRNPNVDEQAEDGEIVEEEGGADPGTNDEDEATDDLAPEWARLVGGDQDDQGDEGDEGDEGAHPIDADEPAMEQILAAIRRELEKDDPDASPGTGGDNKHPTHVLNRDEVDALLGVREASRRRKDFSRNSIHPSSCP